MKVCFFKPCFLLFLFMFILISLCACSGDPVESSKQNSRYSSKIVLMTHDSFNVSKTVLEQFEAQHQCIVEILKAGDAGEALNKAILTRNSPLADIFFGVDNTFLSRALSEDLFVPYESVLLADIDDALKLDTTYRLLPVDYGDVCLNYDVQWFSDRKMAPPEGLEDLLKPEYKGLLVVQNPATSSPGLAFLLTTISRFGENGYIQYWEALKKNDVLITSGWKDAYWGQFSAASQGSRPIVVSYASSPAAEVFYASEKLEHAPTRAVIGNGSAFRQIEFAGILKGSKQIDLAQKCMDFLLSRSFQEDIPLQMFVFPANRKAVLPDVFVKHSAQTDQPARIPGDMISANREIWINEWTENILQ